jgi:hypothetical protein
VCIVAVTEGYTTIRYPSEPQVSHQFPGEPSVGATIFRSAQDILRDVFGTAAQRNSPSAPSSRLKRVHDDIEQDSVLDDEDARMESNNAWHDPLLDGTGRLSRPMKPLRQARKGFVPAGMIFTSSERKHGNPTNSSDDGDTSSRLSPTPFESADV